MQADRQTNKQTYRHANHNTSHPYLGQSKKYAVHLADEGCWVRWSNCCCNSCGKKLLMRLLLQRLRQLLHHVFIQSDC